MPWQGVSIVDQRHAFVLEVEAGLESVTALAAKYGVSRTTAYYWIDAVRHDGRCALSGRSRRPRHSPAATAPDVIAQLVQARDRHPTWGAGKLRAWLQRVAPAVHWPCRQTLHTHLVRAGRVRARRRAHPRPPTGPRHTPTAPNELWTIDFKGQFRTGNGVLCYPLTLRDGYSRFVLACTALPHVRGDATQAACARVFATYGLPTRIRSDNGSPFAARGLAGLTRLAVWWLRLGIALERIAPGCPGQNGAHEQFHRVLKQETARPPAATPAAQQRRFARFVAEYNTERPHAALADQPPATRYTPSPRPLPARVPAIEYPRGYEVRRVAQGGRIKWHCRRLFLSEALTGEDVGFEPLADGLWLLRFATWPLAIFDERRWRLRSDTSDLSTMSHD
jgi:transposase InsO family protein